MTPLCFVATREGSGCRSSSRDGRMPQEIQRSTQTQGIRPHGGSTANSDALRAMRRQQPSHSSPLLTAVVLLSSIRLNNGCWHFLYLQQRERVAAVVHRQETVNCLKTFNARRKLKVCILVLWLTFLLVISLN